MFIFATEDGTISGWNGGTNATLKVDNSGASAVYKGLAMGSIGTNDFLYATNFRTGNIDVFDTNFQQVTLSGSFADPNVQQFMSSVGAGGSTSTGNQGRIFARLRPRSELKLSAQEVIMLDIAIGKAINLLSPDYKIINGDL